MDDLNYEKQKLEVADNIRINAVYISKQYFESIKLNSSVDDTNNVK